MKSNFFVKALVTLVFPFFLSTAMAMHSLSWLSGDETIGPAAAAQDAPAIAQGDDSLLAVWADRRAIPNGTADNEYETSSDIYAVRLDSSGAPLDALPFVVTQAVANQDNPQAVWNGAHWLVVYESYDISGTGFFYDRTLEAVRVAPDGTVVDSTPIPIRNVEPSGVAWTVASDGDAWVIAAQASDSNSALQLLRIRADGTVEQPPNLVVPSTYFLRSNLKLAFADGVYLFTWSEFADTFALRFDTNLAPLDPAPVLLLLGSELAGLAANDTGFYIVWTQQRPNFTVAVFGTRVSTDGAKLDGMGVDISGSSQPQSFTSTGVTWGATQWKVTWITNNVLRLGRVDAAGQPLDPNGIVVPGPDSGPAAGTALGGLQLVWGDYTDGEYDVRTANVDPAGTAGPVATISTGAPQQARVDVAAGAAGYMVTFRSDVAGSNRIMAQPLDSNGDPSTPAPIQLDQGTLFEGPGTPSVAWNGALYLVTWGNASGIVAQRILQDGTLVDPSPFPVQSGFGPTDVEALGDTFLVVGRTFGFSTEIIFPHATRIRGGDGAVLDPEPIALGISYAPSSVAMTTLGDRWLAVWHRTFTHDDPLGYTMAAFVDANGVSAGEFIVYGVYSKSGGNFIFEVTAAGNENTALVVQSAEQTSGVETDLAARIVNADGTLLPAFNLTPWVGNQYRPHAAWDGSQFVVAYNEQKNRFAAHTLDELDATSDLFGIRLDALGNVLDPAGFAFSISTTAESHPAIAAAGGVSLMAGSVLRNEPFAAYRIGYRRFGIGGNQWPVAVAVADATGGDVPLTIGFTATGSNDPDGALVGYAWEFGDGATSSLPDPVHEYTSPGNYVATLTVTDNGGANSTNTVPLSLTAPNVLPVAVASGEPLSGPAPLSVTFFGEGSYDVDGALGNFEWNFSTGGTYFGSTAFQTFTQPGIHYAELTVYDNRGGTDSASVTITVTGECILDCLRSANILLVGRDAGPRARIISRVVVSDENGSRVSNALVTIRWTNPSGSESTRAANTNANGLAHFSTVGPHGTYTLTVEDIERIGSLFDPDNSVLSRSITH